MLSRPSSVRPSVVVVRPSVNNFQIGFLSFYPGAICLCHFWPHIGSKLGQKFALHRFYEHVSIRLILAHLDWSVSNMVRFGSGNELLPVGSMSIPGSILVNYPWRLLSFTHVRALKSRIWGPVPYHKLMECWRRNWRRTERGNIVTGTNIYIYGEKTLTWWYFTSLTSNCKSTLHHITWYDVTIRIAL